MTYKAPVEVSTPALGQTHTLLAVSVESGSEVNAPALADIPAGVNALFADDVESALSVSTPSLTVFDGRAETRGLDSSDGHNDDEVILAVIKEFMRAA